MTRLPLVLVLQFVASASFAIPVVRSVSPASGPTAGGTEVTIKGTFASPAQIQVFFGATPAMSHLVDPQTIIAVTPSRLAGSVPVIVIEEGVRSNRNVAFTFEGGPVAFERILVPLFTPPVHGAFGSEFVTKLELWSTGAQEVYGLPPSPFACPLICPAWSPYTEPLIVPNAAMPEPFTQLSSPGRFIYVRKSSSQYLVANLRVFDVTRDALNYGTEIPVVREREFFTGNGAGGLYFLAVPNDPRFRKTLRIYSTQPMQLAIFLNEEFRGTVQLTPGADIFEPAYGAFSDFPTGTGTVQLRIEFPPPRLGDIRPAVYPPTWAFISVTNNDTQVITTITPQR